jgi:hypothetical protein
MFEDFIRQVASMMGTTSTLAGIVMSLILTVILLLLVAVATKGKAFEYVSLMIGLLSTVMFTAMSWYPIWTGAVMALGIALLGGWYLSKLSGGGSN